MAVSMSMLSLVFEVMYSRPVDFHPSHLSNSVRFTATVLFIAIGPPGWPVIDSKLVPIGMTGMS